LFYLISSCSLFKRWFVFRRNQKSEKSFSDETRMLCTVLWERDIARCPWHREWPILHSSLNSLYFVLVITRPRYLGLFEGKESSITFWYGELWGLLRWRQMNEFLLEICTWSFGVTHVKVMLHTLVARLFPLVIFVIKTVLSTWVLLFALVAQWINFMRIIFGSWYLRQLLLVREVNLSAIAHCNSIEIVTSWVTSE